MKYTGAIVSAGAKRGRPQRGRAPNLHREFTKRFRVDSGVQKMPASPAQTGQAACIVGLGRTAQTRNHTVSKLTLFTRGVCGNIIAVRVWLAIPCHRF